MISRIVNKIRVELEAQGIKVSNADIQAVLWYPEKDLWAKLRGEEESNLKQSYEDEFLKLARERGVGAEAEAAAARVRAARTGGSTEQVTDGGIRQGSGRADKTQGGGFKNLTPGARTGGFLNADILAEGAALIQQGFTTFATWSRAMLQRFGQGIKARLEDIWERVKPAAAEMLMNYMRRTGSLKEFFAGEQAIIPPFMRDSLDTAKAMTARKLLLRGPGRVGYGRGAGTGCEGVCHAAMVCDM